jgi:peptidoglycan LD-endopeptidase LytH
MRQLYLLLAVAAVGCATPSVTRNTLDRNEPRRSTRTLDNEAPPTWLPVPVAGVRPSQLRDSWGDPRSGGRSHEGIDIFARRGTPVLSSTHGYVTAVHERGLGGKSVTVRGPAAHSHYYAHLDSYGRYAPGDWVDAGDTIGYVGTTGNAAGGSPHLHYGIFTGGGPINPYPLLTSRGEQVAEKKTGTTTEQTRSRRTSIEVPGNAVPTGASTPARTEPTQTTATASRRR